MDRFIEFKDAVMSTLASALKSNMDRFIVVASFLIFK